MGIREDECCTVCGASRREVRNDKVVCGADTSNEAGFSWVEFGTPHRWPKREKAEGNA